MKILYRRVRFNNKVSDLLKIVKGTSKNCPSTKLNEHFPTENTPLCERQKTVDRDTIITTIKTTV